MGLAKQFARPILIMSLAFLLVILWSLWMLDPGTPSYVAAQLAAGILSFNILVAAAVIYTDRDI